MRSVVSTATLVVALWLGLPAQVAAQDPDPPPPPPPPREVAVPRPPSIAARDGEARRPGSDEPRTPSRAAPGRGVDGAREPQPAERVPPREAVSSGGDRRRIDSAAGTAASDEQGGAQRRGAVRRPPAGDRARGGSQGAVDRAVPRSSVPQDTRRVYVYPDYRYYNRYYDPWGYGAFGLGYFYYSPWGWGPGYYGYGPYGGHGGGYYGSGGRGYSGYESGRVKLKVKPRDAEVFVDNYFAGYVDDFDGVFQGLKLDRGGYRIEIRKPGYETLHFDVHVQPDRTITYRGEMKPVP